MTIEEKNLLLKDICARLTYGVIVHDEYCKKDYKLNSLDTNGFINYDIANHITHIKPYLRPLSSMTEEEAKEIASLHYIKDILSVKVTSDYIDIIVDDGICSTERRTIWYDEIVSSVKCFDLLTAHHFDYRGLISMGLAIEAPKDMYKITDTTI